MFVAEQQPVAVDPVVVLSALLERVLHLEKVCEVGCRIDAHVEVHRVVVVIEDRDRLEEPVSDGALPNYRQLRVDVYGPGRGHQEEPRLEVLDIVDRQRVETSAIDGEQPFRQESSIEGK